MKLRLVLPLLAMFAGPIGSAILPTPAQAVATTKVPLSTTTWTDLGAGPLLISSVGSVVYTINDIAPVTPAAQGFPLTPNVAVTINTASHVWAMSANGYAASVYVSPILARNTRGCVGAANYLARTTGGNEGGNSVPISQLICNLTRDGVITGNLLGATGGCGTYLDVLYVMAQQNQSDAVLNLCGTTYTIGVGTATFTPFKGFNATPVTRNTTGFIPSTAPSPKYTLNSASYGTWISGLLQSANCQICTSNNSQLYGNYPGFYARINAGGGSIPTPGTNGYFAAERWIAAENHPFYNGVDKGPQANPSTGVDISQFALIAPQTTEFIAAAHVGASLGAPMELALYNRLRTYMSAIGVP